LSSERLSFLRRWLSQAVTRSPVPHRPAVGSMVATALLAVGTVLGFVAVRTVSHRSQGLSAAPPPTTTSVPPAPVTAPSIVPAPPPTTAPAPAVVASSEQCTPSDVTVTTTTDASSYPPDTYVVVTTVVSDVVPCSFVPDTAAGSSCPSAVSIVNASGTQVWPAPGQGEVCSPPVTRILEPGDVETLRAEWNQAVLSTGDRWAPAPAGTYVALGDWSWADGGSSPYQAQAPSASFTVG
jgi:hypothetical protein